MLKQTLEAPYEPGQLEIDGPNVSFTSTSQFLSELTDKKPTDRFQIKIEVNACFTVDAIFRKEQRGFEIVEMTITNRGILTDPILNQLPKHFILYPEVPPPPEIKSIIDQHPLLKDCDIVMRSRCFLCLKSQDEYKTINIADNPESCIFNSIHLPGLRGNPERIYKLSSTGPRYPGTFENYTASIIHEWQETADERLNTVKNFLQVLELTGKVAIEKVGDVGIEVQVGRLPHDSGKDMDMINIADVGFGVSQVLPVVVALIAAEPGQLVYLEQPELHLHPNAQVKLAQVLADAAKRGVRVVAETHSSLLLLGIQTLVAEGKLSPELVKLHWLSRNEDGITEVDSVDLDEAGTYGEWSVDFDDVSLNAQSRFLDAVGNVKFGNKETP